MKVMKSMRPADIVVIVVTVAAVGFGITQLKADDASARLCSAPGRTHEVFLNDDRFSKTEMTIEQCDMLTIINQDELDYQIAFGDRQQHASYPGFKSLIIRQDESITLDAVQSGTYELHDHLRDNARLQLIIEPVRN